MGSSAFDAHADWVRELHESFRTRPAARDDEADATPLHAALSLEQLDLNREEPPVRGAVVVTGESECVYDDLDIDVDAPVYRSIGNMEALGARHAGEELLGGLAERSISFELSTRPLNEQPMDEEWLASMPPLIHRQPGRQC
ncbi:hypothetical protein AB1Y20_013835 [Prymnesium parvum]|uniref:Uncharacterized protein n=1 Tax=Prymnesium parvum TaxID=97485 RepID=A0AB34IHK9_PRYPA|mmetsp:Transcript_25498/g.38433  ORF Transcript_25498/g.38433 Transcript_25498/m.38433 type:complete len:142 (+) Transcript_25498:107-532(+)